MRVDVTSNAVEIAEAATRLYVENYNTAIPVRSVGIKTTDLINMKANEQLTMFDTGHLKREKRAKIDETVDEIRSRFGVDSITRVSAMKIEVSNHNATSFAQGM